MSSGNFKADILAVADNEPIEAITIGEPDYGCKQPKHPSTGKLLSWEEAASWLDYTYHDGFGGAECHPIYAWTPTRVLFVSEYDGSTRIASVPRNPTPGTPAMT